MSLWGISRQRQRASYPFLQLRRKDPDMCGGYRYPTTISYFTSLWRSGQEVVYARWAPLSSASISFENYCFFPSHNHPHGLGKSHCSQPSKMHGGPFLSCLKATRLHLCCPNFSRSNGDPIKLRNHVKCDAWFGDHY